MFHASFKNALWSGIVYHGITLSLVELSYTMTYQLFQNSHIFQLYDTIYYTIKLFTSVKTTLYLFQTRT